MGKHVQSCTKLIFSFFFCNLRQLVFFFCNLRPYDDVNDTDENVENHTQLCTKQDLVFFGNSGPQ